MKKLMLAVFVLMPAVLRAQDAPPFTPAPIIVTDAPTGDLTLGGIPRLIADKLKETHPCGLVDLSGHIGGGAYLPLWTIRGRSRNYAELANIGYRAMQGQKPSVLLMPLALDATSISAKLWNFSWANAHVTRTQFPDFFLGPALLVPLDKAQIKTLSIKDPKPWLGAVGSVRF